MTDRRVTPDPALVDGTAPAQVAASHTDVLARPNGPRDRQLLHGDPVTVLGQQGDHSYIRSDKDGYIGFVATHHLGPRSTPTHVLIAPAGHAYETASFKSPETAYLSLGARLSARGETPDYIETELGHVPKVQVTALPHTAPPTETAKKLVGAPYLWGGNTHAGIDCSGLIQIALLTAGTACPGDSDLQQNAFPAIDADDRQSGDLVFWKGHVGLLLDANTIIHANAFHMAVATEPLDQAIARIAKKEFGAVTGYARP